MAVAISKQLGIPIMEGLPNSTEELPNIITYMILHRAKIDSFNELPKEKRPPRDLWDKPYKLEEFFEEIFKVDDKPKGKSYIEYNYKEVE
jgi:hypothetical protein